jgi:hypothetical protein
MFDSLSFAAVPQQTLQQYAAAARAHLAVLTVRALLVVLKGFNGSNWRSSGASLLVARSMRASAFPVLLLLQAASNASAFLASVPLRCSCSKVLQMRMTADPVDRRAFGLQAGAIAAGIVSGVAVSCSAPALADRYTRFHKNLTFSTPCCIDLQSSFTCCFCSQHWQVLQQDDCH